MRILFAFVLLLATVVLSCKKEPEACLMVTDNAPMVGEPVFFENCSENYKQAIFDPDDGNLPISVTSRLKYTYYFPLTYQPQLAVYNSTENEVTERETFQFVQPRVPAPEQMAGSWKNFRLLGFDNVFFQENDGVFDAQIHLDTLVNIQYELKPEEDLVVITDKDSVRETRWVRDGTKELYGNDTAQVIYYYRDTMVILLPYRYGYSLGYFAR